MIICILSKKLEASYLQLSSLLSEPSPELPLMSINCAPQNFPRLSTLPGFTATPTLLDICKSTNHLTSWYQNLCEFAQVSILNITDRVAYNKQNITDRILK